MKTCRDISAKSWPKQRVALVATRHDRSVEGCVFGLGLATIQTRYGMNPNWTPGKQVKS